MRNPVPLLLALLAAGCGAAVPLGDVRVVYHSTGGKGALPELGGRRYEGVTLSFVNRGSARYVKEGGVPADASDRNLKVIPDGLMEDLLERLDEHGFRELAQKGGDPEAALRAGAPGVLVVDRGDERWVLPEPRGDRTRAAAFSRMKRELIEIHQERTQFHVAEGTPGESPFGSGGR